MRLVRYGEFGHEKPGILLPDGRMIDASVSFPAYDEAFFAGGGLETLRAWVDQGCDGGIQRDVTTKKRLIVCIEKRRDIAV